jgi:NAD(P)-dependent dehydrogenase (short-subunit alcohol dehydrogenase family)
MRLDGQVALVTGGGTGIGAAIARRLAAEGARVAITGRRREPLELVAAETDALVLPGDVADDPAGLVARVEAELGSLDVLVNNAGIGSEDWDRTLAVNLTAPYRLAVAAVPGLERSGAGAIVNVASVAAFVADPTGSAPYEASKAALVMLTRSLAVDLGPRGIRVNAVCPGWVRTPMSERAMERLADRRGLASTDEAFALVEADVPLRRVGEPGEIAAVCAFLASREASFVSGAVVVADGGASAVDVGMLPFARG